METISASGWVCVCLALFTVSPAGANDGFYEGAGATLFPVHNKNLRVVSENLEITSPESFKCYPLLYLGKPAETFDKVPSRAQGTLGQAIKCPAGSLGTSVFQAKFHAKAVYHVKALEDSDKVQMGFPVPAWEYEFTGADGLYGVEVPGVAEFKTTINGSEIKDLETKSVQMPTDLWGKKTDRSQETPAITWHASFKKNTEYELVTEYDFGFDFTNGFYPPAIPKDFPLWWDTRTIPEGYANLGGAGVAESAIYFLHPIKLWASPPPEEISVRFEAPKDVPVIYLVTGTSGLDCVDAHALYFKWKNSTPSDDLRVSFPALGEKSTYTQFKEYGPLKTRPQFEAWIRLLGANNPDHKPSDFFGSLRFSCDLLDQLKKTAVKDSLLLAWTGNGVLKCVESCR